MQNFSDMVVDIEPRKSNESSDKLALIIDKLLEKSLVKKPGNFINSMVELSSNPDYQENIYQLLREQGPSPLTVKPIVKLLSYSEFQKFASKLLLSDPYRNSVYTAQILCHALDDKRCKEKVVKMFKKFDFDIVKNLLRGYISNKKHGEMGRREAKMIYNHLKSKCERYNQ